MSDSPVTTLDDLRRKIFLPTRLELPNGIVVELTAVSKQVSLEILAAFEGMEKGADFFSLAARIVKEAIALDLTDDDAYGLLQVSGGLRSDLLREAAKKCGVSEFFDAMLKNLENLTDQAVGEATPRSDE